jgi:glycosyltransferase involved in cell wall biosynthesis
MKILIDVSQVVYGTGVSVYTKNLVKNLLAIDTQNQYTLFAGVLRRSGDLNEFIGSLHGNFSVKRFPLPPRIADKIFNKLDLVSVDTLVGKHDIFHSSDWTEPRSKSFKITTIHDIVPILYPKMSSPYLRDVFKRKLKRAKKYCDAIIVPSRNTKLDLVKSGFHPGKIHVIYEAVGEEFMKIKKKRVKSILKGYGLTNNYILFVGTSSRKNLKKSLLAYKKSQMKDYDFVVVGVDYPKIDLVGKRVKFIKNPPPSDMPYLYKGASVFLFPSRYEGFGLPILEAFTVGTPVVTSNLGSMKEISQGGAVLVNPKSVESIANGIKFALKNKSEIVLKAKKVAKMYSWEKTARETLSLYKSITEKK